MAMNPKTTVNASARTPKTPGLGGFIFTAGISALSGISQGQSLLGSAARGVIEGAVQEILPGPYWGVFLAQVATGVTKAAVAAERQITARSIGMRDPGNMNFSFQDTNAAYTMRQAAVQAIQGSKLNARSALGGEARLMHKGIPSNRNGIY